MGALLSVPVRSTGQVALCNFSLALVGGLVLLWAGVAFLAEKNAREVSLTVDAAGLGESGYPNPRQNWRLPWSRVQAIELAGRGKYRVLRVYTLENPNRPERRLEDYAFEEIMPEINARLAAYGKQVEGGH
jgi:hypothetical protein